MDKGRNEIAFLLQQLFNKFSLEFAFCRIWCISYHSLAIYLLHLASYKAIVTHSTGLRSQTGGIRSSVSVALLPPNKEKAALCVHTETGSSWP